MVNTLLEVFGRVLHALQDFYAHSNYVEVYGLQATATGQITPWDFFEQSRGESFRPPPDVFTGTFWYPLDDAPEPSHDRWNKDEPNSEAGSAVNAVGIRYFDLARDVAIRASNEAWQWLDRRLTPAAKANIGECCK